MRDERMVQWLDLRSSSDDLREQIKYIESQVTLSYGHGIRRGLQKGEIDTLTEKVADLSLSEQKFAKENAALTSLDFAQRTERYEAIYPAHQDTFRWIFDNPRTSKDTCEGRFSNWLEKGSGLSYFGFRASQGPGNPP